ncbi:hypothetical protein [Bartonella sp. LJL80]
MHRMILIGFGLLLLVGCQSAPKLISPDNIAEFYTRPSALPGIPDDVMKRAAYTTKRRGYAYFTIAEVSTPRQNSRRPRIGFDYGRSPYGFSDPGDMSSGGLSIDTGGVTNRSHWVVTMLHTPDGRTATIYTVASIVGN